MGSLIVISVINYYNKVSYFKNLLIKNILSKGNLEIITKGFSYFGVNYKPAENVNDTFDIISELDVVSDSKYRLFLTGRSNLRYAIVSINFEKQQDLISHMFFNLIYPEYNSIELEAPLISSENYGVFTVVKNINTTTYLDQNYDCKHMGKLIKSDIKNVNIYCNNDELITRVKNESNIYNFIEKYNNNIEYITVSSKPYMVYKHETDKSPFIKIKINYNNSNEVKEIFKFISSFIELISSVKFSSSQNTTIVNELKEFDDLLNIDAIKEKQRENEEKLKKEKEEKLKKMSSKEKKKQLEKEERRFKKNKFMKVVR